MRRAFNNPPKRHRVKDVGDVTGINDADISLRNALRHVLHVLVLHVSPKGSLGGGMRELTFG